MSPVVSDWKNVLFSSGDVHCTVRALNVRMNLANAAVTKPGRIVVVLCDILGDLFIIGNFMKFPCANGVVSVLRSDYVLCLDSRFYV